MREKLYKNGCDCETCMYRSNHWKGFVKKVFLEISQNSQKPEPESLF